MNISPNARQYLTNLSRGSDDQDSGNEICEPRFVVVVAAGREREDWALD